MNPIYDFALKARWKTMPERTFSGEVTITDAVDGDAESKQELPKAAVHLLTRLCEEHQELMTANSITFNFKRRKPCTR